jgi:hypothetical protein
MFLIRRLRPTWLTIGGLGVGRAERAVLAQPRVVSALFDFRRATIHGNPGPSLHAPIVVAPEASADEVATIAGVAVERIAAARRSWPSGLLRITTADLPDDPLTVDLRRPIAADLVAAEARRWMLLREELPGVRMQLGALPQAEGWERFIAVTVPGVDLRGELTSTFATLERIPGEQATRSGLAVRLAERAGWSYRSPVSFSSAHDVPPSEVLEVMTALAELAPSDPDHGNGLVVRWTDAVPHLDVELSIGLEEFFQTPGGQVMGQIPGSETERVALAHQAVLDAAGIPYRLRASAFGSLRFLEVDRR